MRPGVALAGLLLLGAAAGGGGNTGGTYGGGGYQSCVIQHESSGNPQAVNPQSGAGGLYQFLPSTWASTPWGSQYPGGAQTAPVSVQNQAFQWLYAQDGTAPWSTDGCG
jgi:Transglycosylase-like domain